MRGAYWVIGAAAGAVAVSFFAAHLRDGPAPGQTRPAASGAARSSIPDEAAASGNRAAVDEAPDARVEPPKAERPSESSHAQPAEIENLILQFLARHRLSVVSINTVRCDATTCEIAVVGTGVNPLTVDTQSGLMDTLFAEDWGVLRILNASLGTREIAPNAREPVVSLTYQPLVDLSRDPQIAAREQAACAAAWRYQTTNPTPEDVARQYLATAERHLALAAAELGRPAAERIVAETNLGPLIRECGLR